MTATSVVFLFAAALACRCGSSCIPNGIYVFGAGDCLPCNARIPYSVQCGCRNCNIFTYNGEDFATKCEKGYYLQNGRCFACTSPCKECSGSSTSCDACISGYELSSKKCVVNNCQTMKNSFICATCKGGFFLTNNGESCSACSPHCLVCTDGFQCKKCRDGWMSQNGVCIINNCDIMKGDLCITCRSGFYPANGGSSCLSCELPCTACSTTQPVCTTCGDGYTLTDGKCIVPNCVRMNGLQCAECSTGLEPSISGLVCISCDSPCATCVTGTQECATCIAGYNLDGTACVMPNCLTMNGQLCGVCVKGYYLANDALSCIACQSPCSSCMETATHCTECPPGYRLNTILNTCVIDKCDKTSETGDKCVNCTEGFFVSESGTTCIQCSTQCKACSQSANLCTKCNTGYTLESNSCLLSNCAQVDGDRCTKCSEGYFITDTFKCEKCGTQCKECQGTATTCISCEQPYILQGGSCSISNCIQIANMLCDKCADGYYVTADKKRCLACDLSCKTCAASGPACTICADGYVLDSATSVCYKDNCKSCIRGTCSLNSETQTKECICNEKYSFNGTACVMDLCGTCTNGECMWTDELTSYCTCPKNHKLDKGVCITSKCDACVFGQCKLNDNETSFECNCNAGYTMNGDGICVILQNKNTSSTGIIVGAVLGALAVAAIIITTSVLVKRRNSARKITHAPMDLKAESFSVDKNSFII